VLAYAHEGRSATNLFLWLWRCMVHLDVIWVISSESVLVFFMIDDWKIIYFYLFKFNFLDNMLILFSNVL
jgi:hypothetical protein